MSNLSYRSEKILHRWPCVLPLTSRTEVFLFLNKLSSCHNVRQIPSCNFSNLQLKCDFIMYIWKCFLLEKNRWGKFAKLVKMKSPIKFQVFIHHIQKTMVSHGLSIKILKTSLNIPIFILVSFNEKLRMTLRDICWFHKV